MILTGSQLKKLRTDAGLTQQKLAELVSVSQAHIAKIENGKVDPRLSTVNKILQVLTEGEGVGCKDIMTPNVIFASADDSISKISNLMIEKAISQFPVSHNDKIIGTITEEAIIRNLHIDIASEKVEKIMDLPLPNVSAEMRVNLIRPLLEDHPGILVTKKGNVIGIITRSDLLKTVSRNI
ncbi:MAG: CBS domain-containing protein [Candidatus Bathyarchaeota archaeon]|nr:MAG: CBS domain-containing protein [Candidatus Bathyarchaeota archaeon]